MGEIIFFDTEVSEKNERINDFGAISSDGKQLHTGNHSEFISFINGASFLCGHNVIRHDLKFIKRIFPDISSVPTIDTLPLSPLLYPRKPYHNLVKDDKLNTDQLNNPLNDAIKAKDLFFDCLTTYKHLDDWLKEIYRGLLADQPEFAGFLHFIDSDNESVRRNFFFSKKRNLPCSDLTIEKLIRENLHGQLCENANISKLVSDNPVELAYAVSIINTDDDTSITPRWVLKSYPEVENVLNQLRNHPCLPGCNYCNKALDPVQGLKDIFGYEAYRDFDGVPLQERAVEAALHGKSLLAIFPTGGGKSITFQIPALMAGKATRGLTVIISPLQSLMKDQVDNLEKIGITDAVTINGLLDPIERAKVVKRIEDGSAKLLYISPEALRSKSMENLLLGRKIERFVIDEAHCFSAWGQDFRVDYLYIADFIKNLCEKKELDVMIPVSCFTATAKQNVVADIRDYFKVNLGLELELFTASAARKNLKYKVIECHEEDKYDRLRTLIANHECPTIVYVSSTKKAEELAERLSMDGYRARSYHGRMDKQVKSENQDLFTSGDIDIMVATSAFGMGVDKSDVGLVVHYQISNSLENYVQEAGRAGRDQSIEAECFVLFDEEDLSRHFAQLNQTKLNINEIGNVWKAIKEITRYRKQVSRSALEIARQSGWDDSVYDIETRVKTAVSALEQAGYLKRGQNMPRVFADSILSESVKDAAERIRSSHRFGSEDMEIAVRIIAKLISARSRKNGNEAESRIDYIADELGIHKHDVIRVVGLLKEERILADTKDLAAYVYDDMTKPKAQNLFKWHRELEEFLFNKIDEDGMINLKELNEAAERTELKKVSTEKIITILNYWAITHIIDKVHSKQSKNHIRIGYKQNREDIKIAFEKRIQLSDFILKYLYKKSEEEIKHKEVVEFSVYEINEAYLFENRLFNIKSTQKDVEDALYYLSRIGSIKIEGGFLVLYNAISIERLVDDNRIQYKMEDYKKLQTYYEQKAQQIHVVGEYAKKMMENYESALRFVDDYFTLNYQTFLSKYFVGSKGTEITKNITPAKFRKLFGELSTSQLAIVNDKVTKYIVVAAGPGSGKTRILVHKLAALLLMEDVKHEQLLMVTFSRASAVEFKKRLKELIGTSANYVDIKTFHSFCFDLLGRVGDLEKSSDIVKETARLINDGEVEQSRITKTVMVIDEAQDMDIHEFDLVRALIKQNNGMRVVAVGDDDQNVYVFRGSSSEHMEKMSETKDSRLYELVENYRSKANLVEFTNHYVKSIHKRMKKTPIMPKDLSNGDIQLIRYYHDNMMDGVVNKLAKEGASGSVCVLTSTNDEALQITGRLIDLNFKARLIQNTEKVKLKDLDEVRYFIDQLKLCDGDHIIDYDVWGNAKYELFKNYVRSEHIGLCKRMLADFELVAGSHKYVSDFFIFLRESKLEDFTEVDQEWIQVSTMHKAKGREFDTVIIMLDSFKDTSDESKRLLYVAMTRARKSLHIHYREYDLHRRFKQCGFSESILVADSKVSYDDSLALEGITFSEVKSDYKTCSKIVFQLSYQDVFLSYFYEENVQKQVAELRSGDELKLTNRGCRNLEDREVLIFSKSFREKLQTYLDKGYVLRDAKVHMIVFWAADNQEDEVRVLMPLVSLEEKT